VPNKNGDTVVKISVARRGGTSRRKIRSALVLEGLRRGLSPSSAARDGISPEPYYRARRKFVGRARPQTPRVPSFLIRRVSAAYQAIVAVPMLYILI